MSLKKFLLIALISLFCFTSFADDSYKLSVVSANEMVVSESLVTLEGNVEISFSTTNNDDKKTRSLTAEKILIDVDNKCLDALGNVYLSEGEDSTFQGDALSLNWDTLDIVVFGGTSTSDRSNASGNDVKFFITGDRISYSGKNDAVFFQDGIIATRENNPYWSISAKKIALAGSDIFFYNALLKLGRVPIFWLPAMFYPGNRLSFNPAIGYSTNKGKFINTTFEVYGTYPGLGSSGKKESSDSDDATAIATNFLSFLSSDEKENQIRSGWTYASADDKDLSETQKWALETGSYFAVFADAWEQYGLSIGYDTKNYFLNKQLVLSSIGALAYRDKEFRYSLDFEGNYKFKNADLSFSIPFMSDPDVRYDFLNRGTVFGIDTIFKVAQSLSSDYSSNDTDYSVSIDGSASYSVKGYDFKVSSLKSKIDYEWDATEKKYLMHEATLPYISFSSSGTILNIKGDSSTKEVPNKSNSIVAQRFLDEYVKLPEPENSEAAKDEFFVLKKSSDFKTTKQVQSDSGLFTLKYNVSHIFNSDYKDKFEHTALYNKIDGTVDISGNTPGKWVSFTESINPVYNSTVNETSENTSSFKLKSTYSVNLEKFGIKYLLSNFIYIQDKSETSNVDRWGAWTKDDVKEHYINVEEKFNYFKVGVKYILPPLEQILTPSVTYSNQGFTASADLSMSMSEGSFFKPTVTHSSASYDFWKITTSVSGTYDFEKPEEWEGFTASENFALKLLNNKLKFTQTLSLEKRMVVKDLNFALNYEKNYIKFNMKGKDLDPDELKIYLDYAAPAFYLWKNRIGFEGNVDFGFTYDFTNKYNSSLYTNVKFNFAISKFLDLSLSVKSVNNSFYRYYERTESGDEKFSFQMLWKDLYNSFDFIGDGRKSTGFNMNSFSLSLVHYMEDWTLSLTSTSEIKTVNGKSKFVPDFTFLVKWNAIPELKTKNTWNGTSGWEK